MTDTPIISLTDVHKRFGNNIVLDGLDLDIAKGESVVVIGGSGTGKSVMLKCIQGIMVPEKGAVKFDGEDVVKMSPRKLEGVNARCGMLFQGGALFDSLPVWENVAFGLIQAGKIKRTEARDYVITVLEQVGLNADVADLSPAELSGGMQKRAGLARAIATKPEVIFFDEPTTGLDPIMADVINDLIIDCVKKLGATALSITHDMASARKIADRIAMLYRGKIIWVGSVDDIDSTENDYVDQFIHGKAEGPITEENWGKNTL